MYKRNQIEHLRNELLEIKEFKATIMRRFDCLSNEVDDKTRIVKTEMDMIR